MEREVPHDPLTDGRGAYGHGIHPPPMRLAEYPPPRRRFTVGPVETILLAGSAAIANRSCWSITRAMLSSHSELQQGGVHNG